MSGHHLANEAAPFMPEHRRLSALEAPFP
jgi:hypothetical protein